MEGLLQVNYLIIKCISWWANTPLFNMFTQSPTEYMSIHIDLSERYTGSKRHTWQLTVYSPFIENIDWKRVNSPLPKCILSPWHP